MEKTKVPVTKRALLQRINRKLAKDGLRVNANRSNAAELGAYYLIQGGAHAGQVLETGIDLQAKGRELSVLAEWEVLEADPASTPAPSAKRVGIRGISNLSQADMAEMFGGATAFPLDAGWGTPKK
jgi:hypothetical protein